jgi:hypothetical protein
MLFFAYYFLPAVLLGLAATVAFFATVDRSALIRASGWFVMRVLPHQLAGEGFFQDGLTQGFGLLQRGGDGLVELVGQRKFGR